MPPFISCPGCGCPAKNHESSCPQCGSALRAEGSLPKTAAALVLGLATAIAGCGDSTSDGAPAYGVPGTGGFEAGGGGAGGDLLGGGGALGEGGEAAFYGVAGTGGAGGGGGAGGTGGAGGN